MISAENPIRGLLAGLNYCLNHLHIRDELRITCDSVLGTSRYMPLLEKMAWAIISIFGILTIRPPEIVLDFVSTTPRSVQYAIMDPPT